MFATIFIFVFFLNIASARQQKEVLHFKGTIDGSDIFLLKDSYVFKEYLDLL